MTNSKICLALLCLLPVLAVGSPQLRGATFDMKKIKLPKGRFCLVDDEDFEYLNQWKWYSWWNKTIKSYYVGRNIRTGPHRKTKIMIHRVIMKTPKHLVVDHINHNTSDNRKVNLRNVTHQQNMRNARPTKNCPFGIKGVQKAYKKYLAQIGVNNKQIRLGYFKTLKEAISARQSAEIKYYGDNNYNHDHDIMIKPGFENL